MKKIRTIFCLAVLACTPFFLSAQVAHVEMRRLYKIDWEPEFQTRNRYTIAVHPLHTIQRGLRIDFEKELHRPGSWLQIGVMGYHTPEYDRSGTDNWYGGWVTFSSSFSRFDKLSGAGLSLSYKEMISREGFYFNTGMLWNHFNVSRTGYQFVQVVEDGLVFFERRYGLISTRYNQPTFFFNMGKHMALSRNVFLDGFLGLGYMHGFHRGNDDWYDSYLGFGYRGLYLNFGFRIGVLWEGRRTY